MRIDKVVNCRYIETYSLEVDKKYCQDLAEQIQTSINNVYKWDIDVTKLGITPQQIGDIMDGDEERLPDYLTEKRVGAFNDMEHMTTIAILIYDIVDDDLWDCDYTSEYNETFDYYNEAVYDYTCDSLVDETGATVDYD